MAIRYMYIMIPCGYAYSLADIIEILTVDFGLRGPESLVWLTIKEECR